MEIQIGDWVVVTIKREDYYGLTGQVIAFPDWFYDRGPIRYSPVLLDGDQRPVRLAQMPLLPNSLGAVYFFTRSQIELSHWNAHAIEVLGEGYFD